MCGDYIEISSEPERFFLVGITQPNQSFEFGEQTLDELARLTDTAGGAVVGHEHLRLREIHAGTFMGRGNAERIAGMAQELAADGVIIDEDLSPAQTRNLEDIFELTVLDRTTLILDIFALHAQSREGKLQVEFAQLEYLLPRLRGKGTQLSRLGGGIGTRGPGETKLETDRRRIQNRISHLKKDILALEKRRSTQRRLRQKKEIPSLSLIGYTNAGKSTLLNTLTKAEVLVENKLFSTLDPTARRLRLPGGREVVLIDTVGFIRKLPHALVASFRATLEEIKYADILLLVADASSPMLEDEIRTSHEVLELLKITDKIILTVFNKIDLVKDISALQPIMERHQPNASISSLEGSGLEEFLQMIPPLLQKTKSVYHYGIPYHRFDLLAKIQAQGEDAVVEYFDEYIKLKVRMEPDIAKAISRDSDLKRL
ncbi:MAG TPA: GTPase HflX [Candidatus Sumerlaeota bacterium]|nr:MAG: GTPase HflX [candidate division BRC1 bacterium ADurb.Bin183]HQH10902.1 GTPase HflX [Candidatus Sumerlaeota bacterium]HRR30402.1 GTPase HflX [Candidatus Sumerlaeia bacterium]